MAEPPPTTTAEETMAFSNSSPPKFTPPQYTMKDIHDAIPKHCFERSTIRSLSYIARDITLVLILASLCTQIQFIPYHNIRFLLYAAYSFLQGLVFTGLWELAHECGHGALSPHRSVNNGLGLLIHSFLLVPFHSWRLTHAHHHTSTNNLDQDIAFVPTYKADFLAERETHSKCWELVEDTPLVALVTLFFHQLIAWPIYLGINNFALERMRAAPWWKRSHFYFGGDGPNYKPVHREDILVSDLGVGTAALALWVAVEIWGAWNVMLYYGLPYLWTNHWILTITFLQHTDFSLPYYPNKSWSFVRGAASSIDRDFGFIGRHIFHGAIETHVLHHHSSKIPFYHAAEASEAIQKVMGTQYQKDFKSSYLVALWKNYRECRFVEERDPSSEVYFFTKEK